MCAPSKNFGSGGCILKSASKPQPPLPPFVTPLSPCRKQRGDTRNTKLKGNYRETIEGTRGKETRTFFPKPKPQGEGTQHHGRQTCQTPNPQPEPSPSLRKSGARQRLISGLLQSLTSIPKGQARPRAREVQKVAASGKPEGNYRERTGEVQGNYRSSSRSSSVQNPSRSEACNPKPHNETRSPQPSTTLGPSSCRRSRS